MQALLQEGNSEINSYLSCCTGFDSRCRHCQVEIFRWLFLPLRSKEVVKKPEPATMIGAVKRYQNVEKEKILATQTHNVIAKNWGIKKYML